VLFNPRIGSFDVKNFLSFIQADGYNPLSVEAVVFTIRDKKACQQIVAHAVGEAEGHRAQREALAKILSKGPFRPGQLFLLMEKQHIELIISRQEFIDMVAAASDLYPMGVFKDGFWADHWTYFMDLIESYLKIYPDWEERVLFEEKLPYFFSPALVHPRSKKYVLSVSFGGVGHHVRQLNATTENKEEKDFMDQYTDKNTGWYGLEANWQHNENGEIFRSSPIAKLFLLGTLKFATRDAYGMGIEYEGGKPGWDDANNGLVGMVGSGMPETYELVVLLRYIQSVITKYKRDIVIPSELYELIGAIGGALDALSSEQVEGKRLPSIVPSPLFDYWDSVASARETYREKTKVSFSGSTKTLSQNTVVDLCEKWLAEIDLGIQRSLRFGTQGDGDDGSLGITPTYFSYNVTKWTLTGEKTKNGHPLVVANEMNVSLFPLFLEGPTRMMKTVHSNKEARAIYDSVRRSPLRDEGLQMYTISASLKGQSYDMGREMAFAAGWLENQSVWLHQSYKFYLEMLRHSLYEEFFEEMTTGMLPFMDPDVYGRSLMECSSFIASSAFENPSIRGRGFLARLSGATAEFLSMWTLMMIGETPFSVDDETGELRMQLVPALPRWLFAEDDNELKVSFKLFGSIDVIYHHLRGDEDLFGVSPTRYVVTQRDGFVIQVEGPSINGELADKIRRVVFVSSIHAYFE
jgi:hypothetical protein